jgi:hypothetical protein
VGCRVAALPALADPAGRCVKAAHPALVGPVDRVGLVGLVE